MKNRCIITLLLVLAALMPLAAQTPFPENGQVFIDTEVPRIDITLSATDLTALFALGGEYSDTEYPGMFIFKSGVTADTLQEVGVRLRGNTSRVSQKKSFKVSFNTFVQGRKYHGLEKLNLNGEHNDPSIIRSKLGWDILNASGVPSPRANHVRLYINDKYYGLYINVEHVDEVLVKNRFGNNGGNLYKCLYPADLTYKGSSGSAYQGTNSAGRIYDLKTNVAADDYTDLANFIGILNNSSITELPQKLEQVFNVNSYLKYMAMEVLTGHWDGYSYNKNNFYLYHNQATNKFEFIPYDLDNTFGIDWFGINWATRNVYSWANGSESRPLTKRLLSIKTYRDRYTFYLKQLINNSFGSSQLEPKISRIKGMITPYASEDTYRSLDYGWSLNDFSNSYIQALGAHVKYGLIPYITTRRSQVLVQLETVDIAPVISNATHYAVSYKLPITISATVEDEDVAPVVKLFYSMNGGTFLELNLAKNRLGQYADTLAPLTNPSKISYYITASDSKHQQTREPISGNYTIDLKQQTTSTLYINEIMANNNQTLTDNAGDFDDWIELFNGGAQDIWLGDKFLSNHSYNPNQWPLPDTIIKAGGYMVFWADDNEIQGKMHTSFKLNKEGEEIILFDSEENGYRFIDGFMFPHMDNDISYGKLPNGTGPVMLMNSPTPGTANVGGGPNSKTKIPEVMAYPNPFAESVIIKLSEIPKGNITVTIANISGGVVAQQHIANAEWPTTGLIWNAMRSQNPQGIYIVSIMVEREGKRSLYLMSKKLIYLPYK
ncbi:CotH kinase family protein [Williamwhitmania taraxaci]|uniref:Por secretion system C-terminal sorting domain-containing protein n=1 Tax=Williamwhitmania taraxaci TaxID=1640674 RepID=A0A1G6KKM6_9BACT|nr:CotH kinase family protein [Williamwhitmania taraxaci]SDC30876.1 Por secretion system C-terminal sorting domain-containing protein [Williamwhitmania taraxaci]